MALPEVTITTVDGALGIGPENTDGVHVKLGVCSSGTVNVLYSFQRPTDVRATLGTGPLVEALCYHLERAGGPVYAMRVTSSVSGANGSVTQSGTGPVVSLTGTPLDDFSGQVKIITGGVLATATFQYTLDGGDTWSETITTAATYVMPDSGVTLNFAAGTYVVDETYTWTSTAPYYSTVNLDAALDALLLLANEWEFVHVVGRGASAADTGAMVTLVDAAMVAAATAYRYVWGIVECADTTDANLIAQFATTAAPNTCLVAGFCELVSSVSGRTYKRPAAWPVAARASRTAKRSPVGLATSLARVRDGALTGISSLLRDEGNTPALDAVRFTTLRTFVGRAGYYVTRGRTLAAAGSDFGPLSNRRVVNKACRITRQAMLAYVADEVRLNANGTILEADAARIETDVLSQLEQGIVNPLHASDISFAIDRTVNVASTSKLVADVRITPLGYLEDIRVTIGFQLVSLS